MASCSNEEQSGRLCIKRTRSSRAFNSPIVVVRPGVAVLRTLSLWPTRNPPAEDFQEVPEKRISANLAHETKTEPWELLHRYSDLQKLLRVTAWCQQIASRRPSKAEPCRKKFPQYLLPEEINNARRYWVRAVQRQAFSQEIDALNRAIRAPLKGPVCKLNPFVDQDGILRVGGRLKYSVLHPDEKQPMILPRKSFLTDLLITSCHRRVLHGGTQLTLNTLRREYWILRGRTAVKSCIHRCLPCLKFRASTAYQQMGNLPKKRVAPTDRPFYHSGVDFAGPILLRTAKGRGHKAYKAYIAVFVCFVTRAVHLEAVSDYMSEGFLATFRRFTARRGICSTLTSDQGTNFIGASKELRALFHTASSQSQSIANQKAAQGRNKMDLQPPPPGAPHFGGLWEAAVKSVRHILKRVIGDSILTFEEMATLLAQIEACLNSQPLQAISDDPDDLSTLTPGHFLIGCPLNTVPEPSLLEVNVSRLSRWQHIRQKYEDFWRRWPSEYLQQLQTRNKWQQRQPQVRVGDLAVLKDEALPPTKWHLARILEIHPGDDGSIRLVTHRQRHHPKTIHSQARPPPSLR